MIDVPALRERIAVILEAHDAEAALLLLADLYEYLPAEHPLDRASPWCSCCASVETYLQEHVGIDAYLEEPISIVDLYRAISAFWDARMLDFPVPLADLAAYASRHCEATQEAPDASLIADRA